MPQKITKKVDVARKIVSKAAVKTAVRNSPIPKPVVSTKRNDITGDAIARKAFEIFASGKGGSELDNWFQAERELRTAA